MRSGRPGTGWFDAERKALAVAAVVSLLAHHALMSVLPAPKPQGRSPRPIEIVVVEAPSGEAEPAPSTPAAGIAPADEVPPVASAVQEVVPPDETPAEAVRRRERDRREMRLPRLAAAEPVPPRREDPRPEPRPEPESEPQVVPPAIQEPVQLHFVHLPERTDEPERMPDRARFFAQRTQDVAEETRARVTTLDGEESPEAHGADRRSPPSAQDGESDGQPRISDGEGDTDSEREPIARPPRVAAAGSREGPRAPGLPNPRPVPEVRSPARPGGEQGTRAAATSPTEGTRAAAEAGAGELQAASVQARRPGEPGHGPAVAGGPPTAAAPAATVVAAPPAPAPREDGAGGAGGGPGTSTVAPPGNLTLDWRTLEELFGEQADRERTAFLDRRRERRRMGGLMDRMDRVTAQLENFTPDVRPGNQTALDTLYHPYAEYLTSFHRKLHRFWGDGFLSSLLTYPDDNPLNDMTLWVKLEIVVNGDGTIHKVTVVKPSGNLVYDVAAIDAVYQGEPYPSPDGALLSGDGRLYVRWALYRNNSQCGVWNAEPYILPDPPSLHEEGEPPDSEHPVAGAT